MDLYNSTGANNFAMQRMVLNKCRQVAIYRLCDTKIVAMAIKDGVIDIKQDGGNSIQIHSSKLKDFAMGILEFYCVFDEQFKDKNMQINVSGTEIK